MPFIFNGIGLNRKNFGEGIWLPFGYPLMLLKKWLAFGYNTAGGSENTPTRWGFWAFGKHSVSPKPILFLVAFRFCVTRVLKSEHVGPLLEAVEQLRFEKVSAKKSQTLKFGMGATRIWSA
jgi:hypothetical protein